MRKTFLALTLAATALSGLPALAQTAAVTPPVSAAPMAPGTRMQTTVPLGERVVREIMVNSNGGSITLVYDMGQPSPQSRRVLRLENVNGMLEVIYDTEMTNMPLGTGGTPRLVQGGGGMYNVVYDR